MSSSRTYLSKKIAESPIKTEEDFIKVANMVRFAESKIAKVPDEEIVRSVLILDLAYYFAERTRQEMVANRISETKGISRMLKQFGDEYKAENNSIISTEVYNKCNERRDEFLSDNNLELLKVNISVRNDIFERYPDEPYLDLRANAWLALMFISLMEEWSHKWAGGNLGKKLQAIRVLLGIFVNDVVLDRLHYLELSKAIINNRLQTITTVIIA